MFSSLWKTVYSLTNHHESVAIAACLALVHREETIKTAEENASNLPTFHNSYRCKIQNLIENCLSKSPRSHVFLWRMLMKIMASTMSYRKNTILGSNGIYKIKKYLMR